MRTSLLLAAVAITTISVAAPAWAEGFQNVFVSATKDADYTQAHIPANTPVIYISADAIDIAPTAKVTFTWISVDSHGVAPANYVIDTAALAIGDNQEVDSNLTEPTAGWPTGTYRVDIDVDGKVLDSENFAIP